MGNSLGYLALAVEALPTNRAQPLRPGHRAYHAGCSASARSCVALGTYGMDIGAFTPFSPGTAR